MPATDDNLPPKQPIKYLPRAELEAAIRAGGSVLVRFPNEAGIGGGVHATKVEDLPTDAAMAGASGDHLKAASTKADLLAEIARLQAQADSLKEPAPAPAPVGVARSPTPAASPPPHPMATAPAPVAPTITPRVTTPKAEPEKK